MRCRDVERLIIGTSERTPDAEDRPAFEEHMRQCPKCADFLCDWHGLQENLKASSSPRVPAELDERVRARCRAESALLPVGQAGAGFKVTPKTPWYIYAALAVLAFLTTFGLAHGAEILFRTYKITSETVPAFVLILQNVLMLLFAPVILGKLGGRRTRELQTEMVNISRDI